MRHSRGLVHARLALSLIFMLNGLTLSAWVSRIPAITSALDLDTGGAGSIMMGLAIGAVLSFPIAGKLIDTIGSARTTTMFGLLFISVLPLLAIAPSPWILLMALFAFGIGNGGMDMGINAQGVEVESQTGTSMMNSFHGFFSLGGFVGAGIGALMARQGVEPVTHFLIVGVTNLIALVFLRPFLVDEIRIHQKDADPSPLFALPHRTLWVLGAIAFCTAVGEGAMGSWSALYLDNHLMTSASFAAIGYATFSATMLIGRFSGDAAVRRIGSGRLIRLCGTIAAAGLGVMTLIDTPSSMLIGFAAVGLGLSVIYPLVFSAAGNHPTLPRGRAVSGTATVGYTGFLAGPPVLGWIAQATSMRSIMFIVAALCAVAAILAPATERWQHATDTRTGGNP